MQVPFSQPGSSMVTIPYLQAAANSQPCLLLLGPRLPFLASFIYQLLILPMNLAPLLVDSASEKKDSSPHELNLRKT